MMQKYIQPDRINSLIAIINQFIDNKGFDVEFEKIAENTLVDELIDDGSISVRMGETIDLSILIGLSDNSELPLKKIEIASITDTFFSNHIQELDDYLTPGQRIFLKKPSPLESVFIKTRFIEHLKSDPNIIFRWMDFRGYMDSEDEDEDLELHLKEINLGYDVPNNIPVFHIFMDTFIKLGEKEKGLINPFIIDDDSDLILCKQNVTNLIQGEWYGEEEQSIYDVIWKGLEVINNIFEKKYGFRIYHVDKEKPIYFRSVFYPTLNNYELFLSDFAVMMVDNINKKQLHDYLWDHKEDVKNTRVMQIQIKNGNDYFESKEKFNGYGSKTMLISLLELNQNPHGTMINKILTKLWNERSELHHTESSKNKLDEQYYDEQDSKLIEIYHVIYSMIDHEDPDRNLCSEILSDLALTTQFGNNGSILNYIGFNRLYPVKRS